MPQGYETYIEQGGSNVSGGQKQRLCIARALLKKPKILVMDDSTSAVDTATDPPFMQGLREEIPNTTKIIIAQRVSSVQDADRILVLDEGRVNGFGTHEQLLPRTASIRRSIRARRRAAATVHNMATKTDARPRHARDARHQRPKNTGKTMRRTMAFILKHYKWHCLAVVICIVLTVLAQLNGTLFLQKLYDSYLSPMLESGSTDFTPLLHKLIQVGAVYAIGVLCSWGYTRLMVNVSQGTMRNFREKLFGHMESLPISYFDTHSHGDIMSVYTNDIDTLRQFIGQSLPQLFSSIISIVSVFVSMIVLNVPLTLLTLVMVALMLFATKKIAGKSGKFFVRQQQDLGKVNGYIEEMMQGQKVVKVFNHEQAAIERFNELNEQLRDSSCRANSYANVLMPVNAQLGNVSYVLCVVAGAALALHGYVGLTLGTLAAFMTLNRSFNQPITQVSQQLNSVVMAMAGAGARVPAAR